MKINIITNCVFIFAFIIIISFTITNIVLALINPFQCQYNNVMGENIMYYIVSISTANIIFILVLFFNYVTYVPNQMILNINIVTYVIINYVIGIIWFIFGQIMLFKDCNNCALNGSTHIIYAVIMWILPLMHTLRKAHKNKNENLENVYVEI
jgi:asparagine N-glycosylation enzyme membrane subunit Stt3